MSATLLPGRSPPMETGSVGAPVRGPAVLPVLFQLGLVLAVVYAYQLETRALFHVMLLGVAGFGIHALLPVRIGCPSSSSPSCAGIASVHTP